jgi:hypothetical protein
MTGPVATLEKAVGVVVATVVLARVAELVTQVVWDVCCMYRIIDKKSLELDFALA